MQAGCFEFEQVKSAVDITDVITKSLGKNEFLKF